MPDRKQRLTMKHWLQDYRNYATGSELALGPKALQLDGLPHRTGYQDTDRVWYKYHSNSEQAQQRLRVIVAIKSIGDQYELFGDLLFYHCCLELNIDQTLSRLTHYHDQLEDEYGTRWIAIRNKFSSWQRQALDQAIEVTPAEWLDLN